MKKFTLIHLIILCFSNLLFSQQSKQPKEAGELYEITFKSNSKDTVMYNETNVDINGYNTKQDIINSITRENNEFDNIITKVGLVSSSDLKDYFTLYDREEYQKEVTPNSYEVELITDNGIQKSITMKMGL